MKSAAPIGNRAGHNIRARKRVGVLNRLEIIGWRKYAKEQRKAPKILFPSLELAQRIVWYS